MGLLTRKTESNPLSKNIDEFRRKKKRKKEPMKIL